MKKAIILLALLLFILTIPETARITDNNFRIIKISKLFKGLELYSPRKILKNKDILNLTENQKTRIEEEILNHEKLIIKIGAKIKILELELLFDISKNDVKRIDRAKITEHIRKIGKMKTESFLKYIDHLFKIKEILTESQRKMLKFKRRK